MGRIGAVIAALAVVLVGCASDGPGENSGDSASPATSSAAATVRPASGATASAGADPDLHDGVRTDDFLGLPRQFGQLREVKSESDPQTHTATLLFESADRARQAQLIAYFPEPSGDPLALESADDDRYRAALITARENFGDGRDIVNRSVSAGGLGWDCLAITQLEGGNKLDHSVCFSVKYGRLLEVQYLTAHVADNRVWETTVDDNLTAMGEAIGALG